MVDVVCVEQPQASWEERSMKHYAGLDVSVKETSICIVDEAGRICREVKVVSHPEDLLAVLCDPAWRLERVGLEAGPLSQWLFSGLAEAGVPAICIETRHAKAFLRAQVNKSDRNDARDRADDASRLIPTRARQDACKPETKGAPRRSKDTPGKGSCDRERYPWFVAQFWPESRNRCRCRFRAADPRPRRGSAGVTRYYGAFARRAPGLAGKAKLHRKVLLLARDN